MAAVTETMHPADLRLAGLKALDDALGHDNAEKFLRQCRGRPGWDYTKWRQEQPDLPPGEMLAGILQIQAERKAKRKAEREVAQ